MISIAGVMTALQNGNADNDLAVWRATFGRIVLSRNDSFRLQSTLRMGKWKPRNSTRSRSKTTIG